MQYLNYVFGFGCFNFCTVYDELKMELFISRIVVFSANTSTQTMGPRPAAAATAATPAVRTVPQYKYAAGVRNPQQHLNTQPQVAMQQVCNFRNWSCFCCSFFSDERRGCLWLRVSFVIVELRLCIMAPVFSLGALSVFQVHLGWDPVLLHIFQLLDTLAWVFCVCSPMDWLMLISSITQP